MSAGVRESIKALSKCFKCKQEDEVAIENINFNQIECSNCHKQTEQFTNACQFTVNKRTNEVGHAAVEVKTRNFNWDERFRLFQKNDRNRQSEKTGW